MSQFYSIGPPIDPPQSEYDDMDQEEYDAMIREKQEQKAEDQFYNTDLNAF